MAVYPVRDTMLVEEKPLYQKTQNECNVLFYIYIILCFVSSVGGKNA